MNDKPLHIKDVSLNFGATVVFERFSLEIARHEFVGVVGPSGCGKTTLLNLLSRFTEPSSGTVQSKGRVRMVYQSDSLFPWCSLAENVAIGLRGLVDEEERQRELIKMLELIGLTEFANHYPHQLSGGMKQRAELARALIGDTDILLLDEPFSSLDYLTRLKMREELARVLAKLPRTVVLVTHDIQEAAQLADRVIVLSDRPSRVCCEILIDVPRPRELTHPRVTETVHRILAEIGRERHQSFVSSAAGTR